MAKELDKPESYRPSGLQNSRTSNCKLFLGPFHFMAFLSAHVAQLVEHWT